MAILPPQVTSFLGIQYPSQDCDPNYDQIVAMVVQMETIMFYNKMFNNMWLSAGGTRTWNGGSGLLSWTADFKIPVFHWGYEIKVQYGPDGVTRAAGLADGQALVLSVPQALNGNISLNFQVVSQLDQAAHNQLVCGYRRGSNLYLRGIGEL